MAQPWSPEQVVDAEFAQRLIEKQFPELAPAHVQTLGEGFDNTVYAVNEQYVFRFPRREIAVELLRTEGQLLPTLIGKFPVAIPEPLFYGEPEMGYPWRFLGYRQVAGLMPENVPALRRVEAARPLAAFLRALHDVPVEQAVGVPHGDHMHRFDLSTRKPKLAEYVEKATEWGLLPDPSAMHQYLETLSSFGEVGATTLVHGDLHIRNLLVDAEGFLTGVIDWGDTHIGHPALDLTIAYSYLPPEGRRIFFETYGEVDERTRAMARFRAVFSTMVLMLYGHDLGLEQLVEVTRVNLELALKEEEQ
jgi:aminoglycoside phosphotransferase (APT) family kinase protein